MTPQNSRHDPIDAPLPQYHDTTTVPAEPTMTPIHDTTRDSQEVPA